MECGIKVHRVNVGIAGQHIKSIQQPGIYTRKDLETEINTADLQALKEDMFKIHVPAGESIIHVIPQEYTVDTEGGIKDPVGMAGVRLQSNFHIITGSLPAIKNIYRCVKLAGLEVGELTLEPIASSAAVLSDEEKEAGVALVDIGGGTTDIAIFHDGLIRHTAVIPFGGNILTEDIKSAYGEYQPQAQSSNASYLPIQYADFGFGEKDKAYELAQFARRENNPFFQAFASPTSTAAPTMANPFAFAKPPEAPAPAPSTYQPVEGGAQRGPAERGMVPATTASMGSFRPVEASSATPTSVATARRPDEYKPVNIRTGGLASLRRK
jgi:hypothetical protein